MRCLNIAAHKKRINPNKSIGLGNNKDQNGKSRKWNFLEKKINMYGTLLLGSENVKRMRSSEIHPRMETTTSV